MCTSHNCSAYDNNRIDRLFRLASVVTSRIMINLRETLAIPHPEMIKINDGSGSVSTTFNMVESDMSFLVSGENDHGD